MCGIDVLFNAEAMVKDGRFGGGIKPRCGFDIIRRYPGYFRNLFGRITLNMLPKLPESVTPVIDKLFIVEFFPDNNINNR